MSNALPPLPEPAMKLHGKRGKQITPETMDWFTEAQLLADRAAVIEACAKLLENASGTGEIISCISAANAIRSLKP